MKTDNLRYRQVHLDFHNHGLVGEIGRKFDKRKFQEALLEASVDSITCFSKCHHGWSYHETKVGHRHPGLSIDLLDAQIEACHEIGVRVPIYISAGFDEQAADAHPEWILRDRLGKSVPRDDALKPGYRLLRLNSKYLDYLCLQVEEVVQRWPQADGLFFDIVLPVADFSMESLAEMKREGFDPEAEADIRNYTYRCLLNYYERVNQAARKCRQDISIVHNSGHVTVGNREILDRNSHLELESLPTGGWGYDHFPVSARYTATTGLPYLGMTGKFHTTWGEFGGFKRPVAIEYECLAMLAHGARCSIGDQLHPSGEMDRDTYRLIGGAYKKVKAVEPWCRNARLVAPFGLVSAERNQGLPRNMGESGYEDEGAARMLLELHQQFLVLDQDADWTAFQVVILPDTITLTAALIEKADRYLSGGGLILGSGESLLNDDRSAMAIDAGVRVVGRSSFDPDYLQVAANDAGDVLIKSPVVIHGGAVDVLPEGAAVLLSRVDPCFNCTWEHFTSHQHAPHLNISPYAGATLTGRIAYFAHKIFTRYRLYGQPLYRDFVALALRRLLKGCLPLESNLPTAARVSLSEQESEKRYILHVLYAVPVLKGSSQGADCKALEVIEDEVPLRDVRVEFDVKHSIRGALLVPQGAEARFEMLSPTRCRVSIPLVRIQQMVELAY